MKVPFSWLKQYVDIDVTAQELEDKLFGCGFEVEELIDLGGEISKVVVGVVTECVPQEGTHLHICKVDCGEYGHDIQISTGAPNVYAGMHTAAALDGSTLPGGITIKAKPLMGIESNGMLCSGEELGLNDDLYPGSEVYGLLDLPKDTVPGTPIQQVVGLDDYIFDISITANRADCQSVLGIAREVAAVLNKPLKMPATDYTVSDYVDPRLSISIEAEDLCPRYIGHYVRNITPGESPRWMRRQLALCGLRSISNVVDITNYVMVEYGQPMHAFDYRYVKGGKIIVRRAGEDKTLTTLDGSVRQLQPDMLVIADETKPVGLAGIMGGENSEIVDDTADVVFESANFLGASIRKTALALGMRTDASAKFEKDIDPMLTVPAVNRACELVELLGAGEVVDGMIDILNYIPEPVTLPLEPAKINALLGTDIPEADMVDYLRREEVPVVDGMVQVPSWRPDLRCMADLAEEVARYYGYNKIDTTLMRGATTMGGYSETQKLENAAGAAARAMGYSEIITYSFVSPSTFDSIRIPADSPLRKTVKLINPLGEDRSIMRTVILPSMLDILARNFALKNKGVKLYELGKIYLPVEGQALPDEPKRLIFGTYGEHEDFFSMKGEIVALLEQLNAKPATFVAEKQNPSYHPGRCANILIDGKVMGVLGQIHPLIAENYGIGADVYVAELDFTALEGALEPERVFHSLPKFPTVTRDLALVCDESITVGALEDCIAEAGGKLLRKIDLFDIYRGPGIAPGKKSVAFSLELRADDRTLTDEDSVNTVNRVLDALREKLDVVLR